MPTLATQSINRGMSLEAIAALLGHRSMDMTLIYARISDDTVAEAYFNVTEAVEAQYYGLSGAAPLRTARSNNPQPASDHHRHLANGHCTRPALLGCAFESVCERCGFFETGPQFVTILKRQRKHADQRGQSDRSELFDGLIDGVAEADECASMEEGPGPTDHLYNSGLRSGIFRRERRPETLRRWKP